MEKNTHQKTHPTNVVSTPLLALGQALNHGVCVCYHTHFTQTKLLNTPLLYHTKIFSETQQTHDYTMTIFAGLVLSNEFFQKS